MKKADLISKELALEIDQFLKIEKIRFIAVNGGPCTCPEEINQDTPVDELCPFCRANMLFTKITDELRKKHPGKSYFLGNPL